MAKLRSGIINDVAGAAHEGLHAFYCRPYRQCSCDVAGPAGKGHADLWLQIDRRGAPLVEERIDLCVTRWYGVSVLRSFDRDQQIWVMWRNALRGARDLCITSSRDGARFEPARKIGIGTWPLNACPMDGGGIAVEGDHVITGWRREGNIFLAELGKAETKVGVGKDVTIAHGKKGVYSAWSNGPGLEILTPGAIAPVPLSSEGAYVSLVDLPEGAVLAAWETHTAIDTKRVQ